jgi:hypothetical protein
MLHVNLNVRSRPGGREFVARVMNAVRVGRGPLVDGTCTCTSSGDSALASNWKLVVSSTDQVILPLDPAGKLVTAVICSAASGFITPVL